MTEALVQRIARETGFEEIVIARIATLVLRELHLASATDYYVTTGALIQCLSNFGAEAAYHLGGILMYHDDGDNSPDHVTESLVPETMARLLGYGKEVEEIKSRWLQYLAGQRQAKG